MTFRMVAVSTMTLALLAGSAHAQRRGGGGAVSSGVRGAMVGGLAGGESGAQKGAKIGVVAGATRTVVQSAEQRNAVSNETQSRTQYQTTAQYRGTPHSNFAESPPQVLTPTATTKSDEPTETILRKGGKPALGITFPAGWNQKADDRHVTAVTSDGQGWSIAVLLDGVKDKQAGIAKAKEGLAKSLRDIQYDEPTETERGALVVTGTGTSMKSGAEVVFAVGVFESGPEQMAGAAFVVDKDVEDHYKEMVRFVCSTIRGEKDLADAKSGN